MSPSPGRTDTQRATRGRASKSTTTRPNAPCAASPWAERTIYLFAGSDRGGERAAAIYSLIDTAKLNGLDPQAWLRDVFERIADHPNNRIGELLPWNWSPATGSLPPWWCSSAVANARMAGAGIALGPEVAIIGFARRMTTVDPCQCFAAPRD
jgi:hypothetical protein